MKILQLTIKSCSDCPYSCYVPFYSMSHNSGYDCEHPALEKTRRIVDDDKKYKSIPDWCPLADADADERNKQLSDYSITEMTEKTLKRALDILLARFAVEVGDCYRNDQMNLYEIQQKYIKIILKVIKEKLWTSIMMSEQN